MPIPVRGALGSALAEDNAAREAQQHALNLAAAHRQEMAHAREQAEARRVQQQRAQEMANAYRDAQLARETNPARRTELMRQSQGALDVAAKVGQRNAVLAQTRALNASASGSNDNASASRVPAPAQQPAAVQQAAQQRRQAQVASRRAARRSSFAGAAIRTSLPRCARPGAEPACQTPAPSTLVSAWRARCEPGPCPLTRRPPDDHPVAVRSAPRFRGSEDAAANLTPPHRHARISRSLPRRAGDTPGAGGLHFGCGPAQQIESGSDSA